MLLEGIRDEIRFGQQLLSLLSLRSLPDEKFLHTSNSLQRNVDDVSLIDIDFIEKKKQFRFIYRLRKALFFFCW